MAMNKVVSVLSLLYCLFLSAHAGVVVDYTATASYDSGALEVTVNINNDSTVDIIIMSETSKWSAVGFGGTTMEGYTIIVDEGNFYEWALSSTIGSEITNSSITDAAQDSNGTMLYSSLTRPVTVTGVKASENDYFDFSAVTSSSLTINSIWAIAASDGGWCGNGTCGHSSAAATTMTFTDNTGGSGDDDAAYNSQMVGIVTYLVFVGLAMFMIV